MADQAQIDAINAAMSQARAAAAAAAQAVQPAAPGVPAMTAANTNLAVVQGGPPVTMRQMVAEAGMRPDAYLKVDKAGFLVGKDTKTFFDEIKVEFRLNQAKPFYGVRFGNPAKYLRSYDRVVETKSKRPWADVVAEAQRLDPRCTGDYPALDLPFTILDDLKGKDGSLLLAAGKTLGWTSSITNWGEWVSFIDPLYTAMDAGIIQPDALVRGKIIHAQKSGNGNVWGAVTFDLQVVDLGEAQADEAA